MARINKIINILIEFCFLSVIFFTPLYFALFLKNANVFELNKIVLFKILTLLLLLLTAIKIIFCSGLNLIKIKSALAQNKKYLIIPAFFLFLISLATVFSFNGESSFFGSYERQQGLSGVLFYLLFFLLILINIKTKNQINRIVIAVALSSFFICAYGLIQAAGFDPLNWIEDSRLRITGTFGQPNFFASYLLLVIPLGVYLFFSVKRFLAKFACIILLIFQLLCLYFTFSRAGWVGLIVEFIALLLCWFISGNLSLRASRKTGINLICSNIQLNIACERNDADARQSRIRHIAKAGKILLFVAVLLLFFFFLFSHSRTFKSRVKNAVNFQSGSVASRVDYWRASWQAIKQRPILGWGPENQKEILVRYYAKDWAINGFVNSYPDRAHNLILDTLLIGGIVGLLAYAALLYLFFKLAFENMNIFRNSPMRRDCSGAEIAQQSYAERLQRGGSRLSAALAAGVVGYLISLIFGFSVVATDVYFWLFFAVIIIINRGVEAESREVPAEREEKISHCGSLPNGIAAQRQTARQSSAERLPRGRMSYTAIIAKIAAILLIAAAVFWQINKEINNLIADHYFRELQLSYVNQEYFKAYVLYGYIKDTGARTNYYDRKFAEIISGKMDDDDFQAIVLSRTGANLLKEMIKNIKSDSYFDCFIRAEVYTALANEKEPEYFSLAEENFAQAIALIPSMPKNYREAGRMYAKKGEYDKAFGYFNKALLLLPDLQNKALDKTHQDKIKIERYLIYKSFGGTLFKQKSYAEAEKKYLLAYENNIQDIVLFKKIADTYFKRGDINKAIWYNERGMARNPSDCSWPHSIALLYREKGDKENALKFAEKALELSPENAETISFINEISR